MRKTICAHGNKDKGNSARLGLPFRLSKAQVSDIAIKTYGAAYHSFVTCADRLIVSTNDYVNPPSTSEAVIIRRIASVIARAAAEAAVSECGYKAIVNDKGDIPYLIYDTEDYDEVVTYIENELTINGHIE